MVLGNETDVSLTPGLFTKRQHLPWLVSRWRQLTDCNQGHSGLISVMSLSHGLIRMISCPVLLLTHICIYVYIYRSYINIYIFISFFGFCKIVFMLLFCRHALLLIIMHKWSVCKKLFSSCFIARKITIKQHEDINIKDLQKKIQFADISFCIICMFEL